MLHMTLPTTPRMRAALSSPLMKGLVAVASLTIAIIVIAHTWYWHQGISAAHQTVDAWKRAILDQGGRVELDGLMYGGYPFAFEIGAKSVLIETTSPSLAWSWRGTAIHGQASIWTPNVVSARLNAKHQWQVRNERDADWSSLTLAQATTNFTLSDGRLSQFIATLNDIQVAGSRLSKPVSITSIKLSANLENGAPDGPHYRFTGRVRQTDLPIAETFPIGSTLDQLAWALTAQAPLPSSLAFEDIAAWRDDGGTVEIESLSVRWGTLTIDARGTLSLDDRNRPLAALSATVRGHRAAVDSLVQAGTLRPSEGAAAKIALSVFSKSADNGGIVLPFTAQNGWLTAGPLRLLRVQPVDLFWGGGKRP